MSKKHLKAGYTQKEILIYGVVILLGILCIVFGVIALIWGMDSSDENNIIGNNTFLKIGKNLKKRDNTQ